ncbi:MAG: CapA family protein [Alphaproteobacteria bacterium]
MAAGGDIGIILCGDVMLGRGIDQILPHPGDPTLHEDWRGVVSARTYVELAEQENGPLPAERGLDYVWGDAISVFDELGADVRLINLETAVTSRGSPWPGKGIQYRMNPQNIGVLKCAGIDCCALANNHTLDWGYEGLQDTIEALSRAGIRWAGAGRDHNEAGAAAILPVREKGRVLFLSMATGSSGVPAAWAATDGRAGINLVGLDEAGVEQVRRTVATMKRNGDIVVASIHWGGNWGYRIPQAQQDFARALIDHAGVDLVHGHSSHHAKAIEVHGGKLILYGCGDLLSDYEGITKSPERAVFRPNLGAIYCARINMESGEIAGLQIRPTHMRRMRIERAGEADAEWLCRTLNREARGGAHFARLAAALRLDL